MGSLYALMSIAQRCFTGPQAEPHFRNAMLSWRTSLHTKQGPPEYSERTLFCMKVLDE